MESKDGQQTAQHHQTSSQQKLQTFSKAKSHLKFNMQKKHQQAGTTGRPVVIKVKSLAALNHYQTSSKATSSVAQKRGEPHPESQKPNQKSNKLAR